MANNTKHVWNISEDAARLHGEAFVWDNTFPFGPSCGSHAAHVRTLKQMVAGGYSCVALTIGSDPQDMPTAIRKLAHDRKFFLGTDDLYKIVETADDLQLLKPSGKLGVVFQFQGTTPFERDLGLVEVFYKLGVRMALMSYNQKNHVGDGCHERTDAGLSRFGAELVQEMERVGMMVDCSHTGFRTTMDVFEVANGPVIFSHSGPRALWDHERNIWDEQILACAASGGVIGLTGVGIFMGDNDISPQTIFRQIDYIAEKVGPHHVGLGLDFVSESAPLMQLVREGASKYPDGQYDAEEISFFPPSSVPQITQEMLSHGYREEDIRGILGLNWARVARQVWH
jgi:membrane dipeptidase